ncbi:MAG: T9SS type A sorting domain-containing protein, partial [Flavobacterium sp.]
SIPVQTGTHTLTPILENPTYFNVSPSTVNVTFPTQASPFTQNFCVTANGIHPDLEVTLLPLTPARPGFDATYKIIYKNKGNTTQSGSVNLTFNDAVLDLVSANPVSSQATNILSWNFTTLLPFETREITLTLNLNSPTETPAVNSGYILNYNATIASAATDESPSDNSLAYNQTVVNSFDPNDKTCLEGATITPAKVGDYVHYMIRFENNGSANAQNVVVKDIIDTVKFDINTLIPIKGSHSFVTNITSGNKVEFIFQNINLPFGNANNDGYVAFKIKTKATLVVGDTFTNNASIYFDYNFPIVTNTATTTIAVLAIQDFVFSNYFTLYPNPAKDILNIAAKETIEVASINIYNTIGQLVLVIPNAQNTSSVDVSGLTSGNYFIKINSDKGTSNTKFIKN